MSCFYYILDLANAKKVSFDGKDIDPEAEYVSEEILQYVEEEKFNCLDNKKLLQLSIDLGISFKEVLRDVFVTLVEVEHSVASSICEKIATSTSSPFIQEYITSVVECKDLKKKEKCDSISMLFGEDIRFLYKNFDRFLFSTKKVGGKQVPNVLQENRAERKYKQVVILLDPKKDYLGHIYMWSSLSINNIYLGYLYMLEFGSIRTSLRNLLCGGMKNLAPVFVNIVADWASAHGWEYMHVAFEPIGPMPGYLKKCGFSEEQLIKIDELKCASSVQYTQLNSETDMFSFLETDLETWYQRKRETDKELLQSMWFDYQIAYDLHKLFMLSYPDRTITYANLEWLYIRTFRLNMSGYVPTVKKEKLRIPETIADYCQVATHISFLPQGENKDEIEKWFRQFRSKKRYQSEINTKIDKLKTLTINLIEEVKKYKVVPKPGTSEYIEHSHPVLRTDEEINMSILSMPKYNYEFSDENYISALKKIFILKVEMVNFISWYRDVLCAASNGLNVTYNGGTINALLSELREKFEQVSQIENDYVNYRWNYLSPLDIPYRKIMVGVIFAP